MKFPNIVVFDIGASGRANKNISKISRNKIVPCSIYLVEPSSYLKVKNLKNSKIIKSAIGLDNGPKTLYDPEVGGASIYRRNNEIVYRYVSKNAFTEKVKLEEIILETFNKIANRNNIDRVDAFKIDTQGSELDILKSIDEANLLDKCLLFEVEVPSLPTSYLDQPKLSEIIKFFEEKGFWLGNIESNCALDISHKGFIKKNKLFLSLLKNISKKKPMDIDCIFFADPIKIIKSENPAIIKRYALIMAMWGFYLESISIVGEAFKNNLISYKEFNELKKCIKKISNLENIIYLFYVSLKMLINKLKNSLILIIKTIVKNKLFSN